jgi:choline kinase
MKAIILAAGRGSRLGDLTKDVPKCLVKYKSKTLLEHNLENLREYFTDVDITVVGGYRSELLAKYHSNIVINEAWNRTNIVGSLQVCDEQLSESNCLIVYSDIYYHHSAIQQMLSAQPPAILNLVNFMEIWNSRFANPLEDLETFVLSKEMNNLIEIGKKPESESQIQGQFGGIFSLNPEVWKSIMKSIPNPQFMDTTSLINAALKLNINFNVVNYSNYWAEFDSPDDITNQNF